MESVFTATGTTVNRSLEWFGDLGSFSWKVIRAATTRPFEVREIMRPIAIPGEPARIGLCDGIHRDAHEFVPS